MREVQTIATVNRVEHALGNVAGPLEELCDGPSVAAAGHEIEVGIVPFVWRHPRARAAQPHRHPSDEADWQPLVEDQLPESFRLRANVIAAGRGRVFVRHRRE